MRCSRALLATVLFSSVFAACGGDDDDDDSNGGASAFNATAGAQLKPLGVDVDSRSRFTINAPDGAVLSSEGATVLVKAGDAFQLALTPGPAGIEGEKVSIEASTARKFKRYVHEDPAGLIWEAESNGKSSYHLFVSVSALGGFACEDVKTAQFTEAQARLMFQSCRTVTPAAVPIPTSARP